MPHLGKLGNLKKCCVVYIKYWALFSELLVIDTPIPLDKNSKLFCVIDDNVVQTWGNTQDGSQEQKSIKIRKTLTTFYFMFYHADIRRIEANNNNYNNNNNFIDQLLNNNEFLQYMDKKDAKKLQSIICLKFIMYKNSFLNKKDSSP